MGDLMSDALRYAQQYQNQMAQMQYSLGSHVFGIGLGSGGSAPTPMPTEPLPNKLLLLTEEEEMP